MGALKIEGADYTPNLQPVKRTTKEWQALMTQAIKAGGFRRFDRDIGETFIHGPDSRIRHEIYDYVPAPLGVA